jgi:hypothetical protein
MVPANGFVFISGQLPIAPDGRKLADAPFEAQAKQVLANVAAALTAAGSTVSRLVQMRVYVTDIQSWPAFNRFIPTGPVPRGRRALLCRCPRCITVSRSKSKRPRWLRQRRGLKEEGRP